LLRPPELLRVYVACSRPPPLHPEESIHVSDLRVLPPCAKDGSDIDFRWIKDAAQAKAVARYEIAREIFLIADSLLEGMPDCRTQFRGDVKRKAVPGMSFVPSGWPLTYYEELLRVAGPKRLQKFDLPLAVKLMAGAASGKVPRKAVARDVVIRPLRLNYDQLELEYGPDACFELLVSRFDKPNLAQAVRDFKAWAQGSGRFAPSKKGGRGPSTLLHLGYFRFTKGPTRPVSNRVLFSAIFRNPGAGPVDIETTNYGRKIFEPCLVKNGVPDATWSEGVAKINELVMPTARLLADIYRTAKK